MARGTRKGANRPSQGGASGKAALGRSYRQSNNTFASLATAEYDGELPYLANSFSETQCHSRQTHLYITTSTIDLLPSLHHNPLLAPTLCDLLTQV
jgi:hypothetical protein